MLAFTTRAAAREIEKVLKSAVANAEANHGLFGDDLQVSAAYVDEGPTIKRWRARARGRAARIRKRTCHITIKLAPVPDQAEPRVTRARSAEEEKPKRAPRRKAAPKEPKEAKAETKADAKAEAKAEDKPKKKTTTRTRKKKEETEA